MGPLPPSCGLVVGIITIPDTFQSNKPHRELEKLCDRLFVHGNLTSLYVLKHSIVWYNITLCIIYISDEGGDAGPRKIEMWWPVYPLVDKLIYSVFTFIFNILLILLYIYGFV